MQLLSRQNEVSLSSCKRIGLFDSGLGGLSVLRRLAELPDPTSRTFVYVGDTARCPYGNRPAEEISLFVEQIVRWLLSQNVDSIVMACNTSAAISKAAALAISTVPVFDLIGPTAAVLANQNALSKANVQGKPNKFGIMATAATVRTKAFSNAIWALDPTADVIEYACPDLVPIVESGRIESSQSQATLLNYIEHLLADQVTDVVLGCTHFPFLRGQLERLAEGRLTFIDPAQILSGTFSHDHQAEYTCDLRVTGDPELFEYSARICLGDIPFAVQRINISELSGYRSDLEFAMPQESMTPSAVPSVAQ